MQFLLVLISGFKDLNHSQDIGYHKIFYIFSPSIRMSGKDINFDDKKIDKSNFYKKQKTI